MKKEPFGRVKAERLGRQIYALMGIQDAKDYPPEIRMVDGEVRCSCCGAQSCWWKKEFKDRTSGLFRRISE